VTEERTEPALDRLRPLLREEHQLERFSVGYLDLLGDEDLESTGPAQDLMTSRLVPTIYERWWRPALSRALKGITGPGMAEEIRIARLLLAMSPGDTVLDIACGPGNFTREFARAVGDEGLVVGIDGSRTMLERAVSDTGRAGIDNLALVRGNAVDLPFNDAAFDGVCCFAALHLFDDPMGALDEMARVLKPGGRIALMTSVRRQLAPGALTPVVERVSGMKLFGQKEIVEELRQRGFDEIHQRLTGVIQFIGARLSPEGAAQD
jgi:SAM-dependent methyltransferase